jgi:cytidine deaminase
MCSCSDLPEQIIKWTSSPATPSFQIPGVVQQAQETLIPYMNMLQSNEWYRYLLTYSSVALSRRILEAEQQKQKKGWSMTMAVPSKCPCESCRHLLTFLQSSTLQSQQFRVADQQRKHIMKILNDAFGRYNNTFTFTITKASVPYTLHVTKNE